VGAQVVTWQWGALSLDGTDTVRFVVEYVAVAIMGSDLLPHPRQSSGPFHSMHLVEHEQRNMQKWRLFCLCF
jgi:hypothetical protein